MSRVLSRYFVFVSALALFSFAQPAQAANLNDIIGPPRLDISFSTGFESSDPFIKHRGLGLRARLMPVRFLGVDVLVAGMPDSDTPNYSDLTYRMVQAHGIAPDISKALLTLQASIVVAPLIGKIPGPPGLPAIEVDWYFTAGGGYVQTEDDAEIMDQQECIGDAYWDNEFGDCWYIFEAHPAWSIGMGFRGVFFGGLVLGLEVRSIQYTEKLFSASGYTDPVTEEPLIDPTTGEPADYKPIDRRMLWWSLSIGGSIPFRKP